jgi:hypothetical protein
MKIQLSLSLVRLLNKTRERKFLIVFCELPEPEREFNIVVFLSRHEKRCREREREGEGES